MGQPFLVTQVFIGGHLVAIEKSSYADVLGQKLDQDKRNEQIKTRMQDQHKRLLKNLVKHEYDDKIALYFGEKPIVITPPAVVAAAESIPRADTGQLGPVIKVASVPAEEAKAMPVADEIPDQRHSPYSGIVAPIAPPPNLDAPEAIDDEALFKVFDEELQKQVPWSPTNQVGALPPLDPEMFDQEDLNDTQPPERASNGPAPARHQYSDRTSPDRTLRPANSSTLPNRRPKPPPEASTEVGRKPPPVADTLVDFGLPAALKEQLGQAKAALEQARKKAQELTPTPTSRKSDPRVARFRMPRSPSPSPKTRDQPERETQIDMALRRRASSGRGNSKIPGTDSNPNAETLIDVNASEIQEYIARKKKERADSKGGSWGDQVKVRDRDKEKDTAKDKDKPKLPERRDSKKPTAPPSAAGEDSKRPNLLVVERSLDEVILSYLADEE